MPGYKTHLGIGFVFLLIVLLISKFNLNDLFYLVPIMVVYSLLPDIDLGNSKIGRSVRMMLSVLALVLVVLSFYFSAKFQAYALLCLSLLLLLQFVRHRKFTHTIRSALLFSLPIIVLGLDFFIFAFLNYFFHLLFDKQIKF